jgi:hypothetical protein
MHLCLMTLGWLGNLARDDRLILERNWSHGEM